MILFLNNLQLLVARGEASSKKINIDLGGWREKKLNQITIIWFILVAGPYSIKFIFYLFSAAVSLILKVDKNNKKYPSSFFVVEKLSKRVFVSVVGN